MKRSENWSRPIPSIGLGRQTATTLEFLFHVSWQIQFIHCIPICFLDFSVVFIAQDILDDSAPYNLTEHFHNDQSIITLVNCGNGRLTASMKELEMYNCGSEDTGVDLLTQYLKEFRFIRKTYCRIKEETGLYI